MLPMPAIIAKVRIAGESEAIAGSRPLRHAEILTPEPGKRCDEQPAALGEVCFGARPNQPPTLASGGSPEN